MRGGPTFAAEASARGGKLLAALQRKSSLHAGTTDFKRFVAEQQRKLGMEKFSRRPNSLIFIPVSSRFRKIVSALLYDALSKCRCHCA